jgi:hypothetical protein
MCAFSYRPSARPAELLVPNPKLKFLDQCREIMLFKRFSRRTVEAYLDADLHPRHDESAPCHPQPARYVNGSHYSSTAQ